MKVTGSIVLSKLQIENEQYYIDSSAEEVVRFIKADGGYELSPNEIDFEVYKTPRGANDAPLKLENNFEINIYDTEGIEVNIEFGDRIILNESTDLLTVNLAALTNELSPHGVYILVFSYKRNSQIVASKAISIRDGVSKEMAEFSVNLGSINAAVGNSYMEFSDSGLSLSFDPKKSNSGLRIYRKNEDGRKEVFYADSSGNLCLEGVINASGGEIGGFSIANNTLRSTESESPSLVLDGKNGWITAKNIVLGDGATIDSQIQLGNSFIYNPSKHTDRKFIKSGNIIIYDNGEAAFGQIKVNGEDSEIKGKNWSIKNDYANFKNINVSGAIETVVFKTNSVQAAGGAMIFRPSYKVSLVIQNGAYVVLLEDKYEGAVGNTVQIVFDGTNQGYTGTVSDIADNIITVNWIDTPTQELTSATLIDYGSQNYTTPTYNYPIKTEIYYDSGKSKITDISTVYSAFSSEEDYLTSADLQVDGETLKSRNKLVIENDALINSIRNLCIKETDVLIGINSGNTSVGLDSTILPRGLTLTTSNTKSFIYTISTDNEQIAGKTYYKKEDDKYSITTDFISGEVYEQTIEYEKPKLYLGELSQVDSVYSGYGLYADNVFLNGSLTTKVGESSYAGVNTLNGVAATAFESGFVKRDVPPGIDKSKIVFWAGAESTGADAIAKAYFQVTEAGSLYAQRAKLEDTLVVGGTIEAAEIYTARLHGKEGSLTIYDDAEGIKFKYFDENDSEQDIFSINASGLVAGDKNFISIGKDQSVNIIATQLRTANDTNHLSLETTNSIPALKHTEGTNNCGFYFEKTNTVFKMGNNPVQSWASEGTKLYSSLELNKNDYSMQYKQESNGYNLYVVMSQKEE